MVSCEHTSLADVWQWFVTVIILPFAREFFLIDESTLLVTAVVLLATVPVGESVQNTDNSISEKNLKSNSGPNRS